jgi:hypothetical protein
MHPDPDALDQLAARGVAVEVLATPQAVRRYRQLDPKRTPAPPALSADRVHTIEDRALRQLALHRELEGLLAA